MSKYHLSFDEFHGVSTDGAPVLVGSKISLVMKIRAKFNSLNLDADELCMIHYIIHQQNLYAKSINFTAFTAVTCVNLIKINSSSSLPVSSIS
jgi:hypothetical protein